MIPGPGRFPFLEVRGSNWQSWELDCILLRDFWVFQTSDWFSLLNEVALETGQLWATSRGLKVFSFLLFIGIYLFVCLCLCLCAHTHAYTQAQVWLHCSTCMGVRGHPEDSVPPSHGASDGLCVGEVGWQVLLYIEPSCQPSPYILNKPFLFNLRFPIWDWGLSLGWLEVYFLVCKAPEDNSDVDHPLRKQNTSHAQSDSSEALFVMQELELSSLDFCSFGQTASLLKNTLLTNYREMSFLASFPLPPSPLSFSFFLLRQSLTT